MTFSLVGFFLLLDAGLAAGFLAALCLVTRAVRKLIQATGGAPPGKTRTALTVVLFLSFLLIIGWILNRFWLPHKLHPLSLAIDALLIVALAALGWIALVSTRGKAAVVTGVVGTAAILFSLVTVSLQAEEKEHTRSLKDLSSLPYLTWVPVDDSGAGSGVVFHDESESFKGINLYNSRNLATAHLMDMNGRILHSWSAKIEDDDSWFDTELFNGSNLLAIVKDKTLLRMDWDSNVLWTASGRFHHDISVCENNNVHALSRKDELTWMRWIPLPILNDYIVIFTEDGKLVKEIPLFRLFEDEFSAGDLGRIYLSLINPVHQWRILRLKIREGHFFKEDWASDVLHTNTCEMILRDVDDIFRTGRFLFCSRVLDLVAVIDLQTESVLWSWGQGVLDGPHHPTLLENGNLLIFDNGAFRRGYSRVIELDPHTRRIVWEYQADPPEKFFTVTRGASQRLPNGNTLITNSDSGLAFEITRDGTTVWEFRNPVVLDEKYRAAIYRFTRIVDREIAPLAD